MEDLIKYRAELMGMAIGWIILFHANIAIPNTVFPLRFIHDIGYAGVDVFFLLSGIGLVCSISKDNSLIRFYKKRVFRILPVFWICLVFFTLKNSALNGFDAAKSLLPYFGLDFLIFGNMEFWFIPSILLCYLVFPVYYSLSEKYGPGKCLVTVSMCALAFSILAIGTRFSNHMIFSIRFPVFIFGVYIGMLLLNRRGTLLSNIWLNSGLLIASTAALFMIIQNTSPEYRWHTGLWWYPTIIMAFPLSLLTGSFLSSVLPSCPRAGSILQLLGTHSLELYLIHVFLFSLANVLPFKGVDWNLLRIPEYLMYTLCALGLSILLRRSLHKMHGAPAALNAGKTIPGACLVNVKKEC